MHSKPRRTQLLILLNRLNNNFFLLATFDARDRVTFYNFPSTSEFTICLWINLYSESEDGMAIAVQYSQKNSAIRIMLRHKSRTETELHFLVGPAFQQENEIR